MDDTTNEPMPVREKTVPQQPPPLPQGSILGGDTAAKPAAPAPVAAGPSTEVAAAINAVSAATKLVVALEPQTRNIQTATRMLNDACGLLQKA